MTASPLLDVAAVMSRYGLRDRRSARKVMDAAGAFVIGGRLLVAEADLLAHEAALKAARRPAAEVVPGSRAAPSRRGTRRARQTLAKSREPLAPGWWRASPDESA